MKYLSIMWTIILLAILGVLTMFGLKYKSVIEYKKLEREVVSISKKYIKSNETNNNITIKLEDLIKYEPKLNDFLIDNCDGKVTIKKQFIIKKYKVNLNCDNYNSND